MDFKFSSAKNELLKASRNISFDEVLMCLKRDNLLADIAHPSAKHNNQRIYVIKMRNYAYAVPYVINKERKEIFLKTIYPSRAFTNLYLFKRS